MSIPSELLRKWEGRVIDGKFALQQWLGGSDHSVVFLTHRTGKDQDSQKAAIKLISADGFSSSAFDANAKLNRWREISALSHPNLIRLFEFGQAIIDHNHFLYLVMEYAEENLAEILPQRPLSLEEVSGMFPATTEAIEFLHKAGFIHGRIKPANVMAVKDHLKISLDGLAKPGERPCVASVYDAPEVSREGLSEAADTWSLGSLLVTSFTQHWPPPNQANREDAIPASIPQPFHRIAQDCLHSDPQQRCTTSGILAHLSGAQNAPTVALPEPAAAVEAPSQPPRSNRSMIRPVAILLLSLGILIGAILFVRRSPVKTESPRPTSAVALQPNPAADLTTKPTATGTIPGRVVHQVLPNISRASRSTLSGRMNIDIQVFVNASGKVSRVRIAPPIPSRYFASRSLEAARRWSFDPPKIEGKSSPSQWLLRFEFGRNSKQAVATQIKP